MFLKPCTSSRKKKKKISKNAKKKTEFTGTYSNKVWDAILKCGITIEELYPYKGVITKGISLDKLKFHKLCNIQRYGLVRLDKYDDTALMRSVAKQPTVVSVNACQWPQKGWKCVLIGHQRVSKDIDHEVIVVGFANHKVTKIPNWEF